MYNRDNAHEIFPDEKITNRSEPTNQVQTKISIMKGLQTYLNDLKNISVFQIFFLIPKVQEVILADPGTLSGELQGKLGLEPSKNSIFQKLTSKIGSNSHFAIFTKKSKI